MRTRQPCVWDAVIISYVRALKIRRLTFEAGALFAGRMPMTSCYVGGGVTNDGTENLDGSLRPVRDASSARSACSSSTSTCRSPWSWVSCTRPSTATLRRLPAARHWLDHEAEQQGLRRGPRPLPRLGRVPESGRQRHAHPSGWHVRASLPPMRRRSTGPRQQGTDRRDVPAGHGPDHRPYAGKKVSVAVNLREDISHSRYDATAGYESATSAYPGCDQPHQAEPRQGRRYTYMKAPRWAGKPCEVGRSLVSPSPATTRSTAR